MQALAALDQAGRLSPRPPASYLEILREIRFGQGRWPRVGVDLPTGVGIDPGYSRARMWNAAALAAAGQIEECRVGSRRAAGVEPGRDADAADLCLPFTDSNEASMATKRTQC